MAAAGLRLEDLDVRHAAGLFAALDDERVGRFIGGPDVTTLEALHRRIAHLHRGPYPGSGEVWRNFAVLQGDVVVGRVEATIHDGFAEIAYLIGPAWWGRGYGTEAAGLLLARLAEEGVTDLWATTAADNHASVGVLLQLGFIKTAAPDDRTLLSYDEGDRVFRRSPQALAG